MRIKVKSNFSAITILSESCRWYWFKSWEISFQQTWTSWAWNFFENNNCKLRADKAPWREIRRTFFVFTAHHLMEKVLIYAALKAYCNMSEKLNRSKNKKNRYFSVKDVFMKNAHTVVCGMFVVLWKFNIYRHLKINAFCNRFRRWH